LWTLAVAAELFELVPIDGPLPGPGTPGDCLP